MLHPPGSDGPDGRAVRTLLLERARAELEKASAATSPDVRLRFDLGEVYFDLDRYEDSIQVLEPALAMAPHDSASASAWLSLAFAAAHLDRSRLERDAYDAYLKLSLNDRSVLNVLSNRAESEMRMGNLDEAIAGYREVIDRIEQTPFGRATDYEVMVLARWGLAVALDRNGDPIQSEREAFTASEEDPTEGYIGNRENVFFVPDYERDWYYAIGRAQRAKHATDPGQALRFWKVVVDTWSDYLRRAAPTERWIPLAKAHLASAERESEAAAARYARVKLKHETPIRLGSHAVR
jgi:tetratricopeptide (TPR) repeat protein